MIEDDEHREDDLDLSGGSDDDRDPDKPKTTRRTRSASSDDVQMDEKLRKSLEHDLKEVGELLGDTDFGRELKKSALEMSKVLAAHAHDRPKLESILKRICGPKGILGALRAFGPTGRIFARKVKDLRDHDDDVIEDDALLIHER